jgi:hypothetical protein
MTDKTLEQGLQIIENNHLTNLAKLEAEDMYRQLLNGHTLVVAKPLTYFITVHDQETAINSSDYSRIRKEHFEKLKSNKV